MKARVTIIVLASILLVSCDSAEKTTVAVPSGAEESLRAESLRDESLERGAFFSTETHETTAQSLERYLSKAKAPYSADALMDAADTALRDENYQAVENLIAEYQKLNPDDPRAYYKRGMARYNSADRDDEDARLDIEKALALGLDSVQAYNLLAQIHDGHKRAGKAMETLNAGIKRYPDKPELLRARASLLLTTGDTGAALADYDRALELDNSDRFIHLLRGQLYEKLGRYEEALRDYDLAASEDCPKHLITTRAAAMKVKAALLARLKRFAEAIATMDEALVLEPKDDDLRRLRGEYYLAIGQNSKAVKDLTAAIDASPDYAQQAYAARARAYEGLGRSDLAASDRASSARIESRPAERSLLDKAAE